MLNRKFHSNVNVLGRFYKLTLDNVIVQINIFFLYLLETRLETEIFARVCSTMEYGGIIWEPYTETNINRLERIQRQAARFITGDYRAWKEGSVSTMLVKLELQELKERRTSQKLILLYKVAAIEPNDYLKKARPKRSITAKQIENYQATNIVEKQVKNNTKCFDIPSSKTQQFSNSVFVKTLIDWNHLELCAQLVLRDSNLTSQTVNKSTVLSLPLDISQNWLLQRTLIDTDA